MIEHTADNCPFLRNYEKEASETLLQKIQDLKDTIATKDSKIAALETERQLLQEEAARWKSIADETSTQRYILYVIIVTICVSSVFCLVYIIIQYIEIVNALIIAVNKSLPFTILILLLSIVLYYVIPWAVRFYGTGNIWA